MEITLMVILNWLSKKNVLIPSEALEAIASFNLIIKEVLVPEEAAIKEILDQVFEGKISPEEALKVLEGLKNSKEILEERGDCLECVLVLVS